MTYDEEIVRRTLDWILRGDRWRGKFLCQPCVEKLTMEQVGKTASLAGVGRAVDQVFKQPGALDAMPTYQCARCFKTMPCLGVATR